MFFSAFRTLFGSVSLTLLVLLAGCAWDGFPAGHVALLTDSGTASATPLDPVGPHNHPDTAGQVSQSSQLSQLPAYSDDGLSPLPSAGQDDLGPDTVRLVSLDEPGESDTPSMLPELPPFPQPKPAPETLADDPGYEEPALETYPIDLPNALTLAGANNLDIQLIRERVREAQLDLRQARMLWIPSLRAGLGYNRHDGRLQATKGNVIDAGRNSLFLGGGTAWGTFPAAGGAGGPARLAVDLSLADAWFERLAAKQMVCATAAAGDATMNDTLLAVAAAYFDLVEAWGLLADAEAGLAAAHQMADLTAQFAKQGQLAESEVARADTERELWRQQAEEARRETVARSAELVRLLRLDPRMTLIPVEDRIVPVEIIQDSVPLDALHSTGLSSRPELRQYRHLVAAADERIREEHWRPWLPHLAVGYGAGTFGGGPSGTFENQSGRGDFDALAVWELRNLGIGNQVLRGQRASQQRQAYFRYQMVCDKVRAEITTAAGDVQSYRRQIDAAAHSLERAGESYRLNLQRIRGGEGLPIELVQAIRARGNAQDAYTMAVANYNRAQFRLLRALGQTPGFDER